MDRKRIDNGSITDREQKGNRKGKKAESARQKRASKITKVNDGIIQKQDPIT